MYNQKKILDMFQKNNCDTFIATTKENIRYLAGFFPVCKVLRPYTSKTFAVVNKYNVDKVHIVHSLGEIDQLVDVSERIGEVTTYGEFYREDPNNINKTKPERILKEYSDPQNNYDKPEDALKSLLCKLNSKNIMVDEEGLDFNDSVKLNGLIENNVKHVKLGSKEFKKVRSIKTDIEIDLLKKATNILENAILHIKNLPFQNINEEVIVSEFNKYVVSQGGSPVLPMIKVGKNSIGGQRKPSDKIFFDKDSFIWFDCDINYLGYWADVARIIVNNIKNYNYSDYYNILRNAQRKMIDEIRPGMHAKEVYDYIMKNVKNQGIPHYKRQHVGHGIGLEPYEMPVLSKDNDEIIEENMVLCIETPYYEYGIGAIHIEDLILVKADGNIILNNTNGNIIERSNANGK